MGHKTVGILLPEHLVESPALFLIRDAQKQALTEAIAFGGQPAGECQLDVGIGLRGGR